jgi:antitoxin ParD1/3/4
MIKSYSIKGLAMRTEKAERVTITLPPDMLASIKSKVSSGSYSSTSEVIREAMRLWQQKDEERQARLALIRERLKRSAQSGHPVPLDAAFERIKKQHERRMEQEADEKI